MDEIIECDDNYDDYYADTMGLNEVSFAAACCAKKAYTVLTEKDIMGRIDKDINKVCSALHVSRAAARILLSNFHWNVFQVMYAWFSDEELVRKNVGLLQDSVSIDDQHANSEKGVNEFTCSMCFGDCSCFVMMSAGCDHLCCKDCYKSYIESKIDFEHCVRIKCPQPNCGAALLDDVVETLVSDESKKRFYSYIVRSYVEEKRNIKWCPSPGCDYAIEFELGSGSYDVECHCACLFCWNCVEEIHTPVDCETAKEWSEKNKNVSSNLWISAYTKPCPKCKKPIENSWGMQMTCPKPCGHQFCWACLGDWNEHDGSYHKCNVYTAEKKNGGVGYEANRQEAVRVLKRYRHYYERWALNQSSREKAEENLKDWKSKIMDEEVMIKCGVNSLDLQFITDAWLQITECRRVLKWSYVYAFYMSEEENGKKKFFEFWQGEAEAALERLHHCAKKDLEDYLNGVGGENHNIKVKVITLTKATKRCFATLVRALENGLEDAEGSSGCKRQHEKLGAVGASTSTTYDDDDGWDCQHCTYFNTNNDAEDCEICALPRR